MPFRIRRSDRKGFALVLSLALTGLVLALALVFAGWVQFSARKIAVRKDSAKARDLAYAALREALFELEDSWSADACLIAMGQSGQLMGFREEGEHGQAFADNERAWVGEDGEALFCSYHIDLCDEAISDSLLVGGLLTSASREGFRENIQAALFSNHQRDAAFGEASDTYGPLWRVLESFVNVCDAAATGGSLNVQAYGPEGGGESFVPFVTTSELFLGTRPHSAGAEGTSRGDPVFFGLHPWLSAVEVTYTLQVERLDVYYVLRIFESLSVELYNPYDVALAESRYHVLGDPPVLAARVGSGPDMNVLLKHEWTFAAALAPGELKTICVPSRLVYEFPPLMEQGGGVYLGLAGGLPEVRKSSTSAAAGSGRALREAFMSRRTGSTKVADGNKPVAAHQIRFYLEAKDASRALLQRVTDASVQCLDIAHGQRSLVERSVWELPPLQVLAQQGERPIVAWNYEINGALPNPGAPVVSAGGKRSRMELKRLHIPRKVNARSDLLLGLRSFYASDPLFLSQQASTAWTKQLGAMLWDDYFYPLSADHYRIYPRNFLLEGDVDPRHVLLKDAMSVNTAQAQRWDIFLKRITGLSEDQCRRLAQALSGAISCRMPLRSVSAFWEPGGILDEALDLSGVSDPLDKESLMASLAERLVFRPDTFHIKGQGSLQREGGIMAQAACEAVVQRLPDEAGGRMYKVVAFRWR